MTTKATTSAHGALSVLSLLGGLLAVVTVAFLLTGLRPAVVLSDSMSPALHAGDVVITAATATDDLAVGHIVSVPDGKGGSVTHRIAQINVADGTVTLKGDANESADRTPYGIDDARRVVAVIPWIGHVVAVMASPVAIALVSMALVLAAALLSEGRVRLWLIIAITAAAVIAMLVPRGPVVTSALWSDTADLSSGEFTIAGEADVSEGCVMVDSHGNVSAEYTCSITRIEALQWTTGTNLARDYKVFYDVKPGRTGQFVPQLTLDLRQIDSLTGSADPWSWDRAGLLDPSGQFTPPEIRPCAELPMATGRGALWSQHAYFVVVQDRDQGPASPANLKCS